MCETWRMKINMTYKYLQAWDDMENIKEIGGFSILNWWVPLRFLCFALQLWKYFVDHQSQKDRHQSPMLLPLLSFGFVTDWSPLISLGYEIRVVQCQSSCTVCMEVWFWLASVLLFLVSTSTVLTCSYVGSSDSNHLTGLFKNWLFYRS